MDYILTKTQQARWRQGDGLSWQLKREYAHRSEACFWATGTGVIKVYRENRRIEKQILWSGIQPWWSNRLVTTVMTLINYGPGQVICKLNFGRATCLINLIGVELDIHTWSSINSWCEAELTMRATYSTLVRALVRKFCSYIESARLLTRVVFRFLVLQSQAHRCLSKGIPYNWVYASHALRLQPDALQFP